MFPLGAGPWPGTVDLLRARLVEGLRAFPVRPAVDVDRLTLSGQWPVLDELALSLSGLRADPAAAWITPRRTVERLGGPVCHGLRVVAVPLRIGDHSQTELELQGTDVQFDFLRDEEDRCWLVPAKVGGGSVHGRITSADLDRLFLETARGLAGAQGITVDDARVRMTAAGTNTMRIESEIAARKLFVKGVVRISGMLGISPEFEVRLRELGCEGVGGIGAMAARIIQPQMDRFGDRPLRPFGSWVSGLRLEQCELRHEGGDVVEFIARLAAT